MNAQSTNTRGQLARDAAVLQLKLLLDGLRDALLIPLSLLAALIGLLRGGEHADHEFQQLLKLGRRSERWINLFGTHSRTGQPKPGGSLDQLLERVESVVTEQYSKGRNTEEARAAIKAAMDSVAGDDSQGKPETTSSRPDHRP